MLSLFGGGVSAAAFGALAFVDPAKVLQYVRADVGVTESAGRVSAWADRSGNGYDYVQATGANQPLYSATGGPNSTPTIRLDGSARRMTAPLPLPAPGTTPTLIWLVGRQVAWAGGRRIVSSSGNLQHLIYQNGASPQCNQYNGGIANSNTAGVVGSWFRWEAWFAAATSDRLRIGATNATGQSASTGSAQIDRLLGSPAGATADFEFGELLYLNADLSAGEKTAIDGYVTARYGAGLV